jgi:hypothetical protein
MSFRESIKESLKEFFHFMLTGKARIPTVSQEEKDHLEFVKAIDELTARVFEQQDKAYIKIAPPPPPVVEYKCDLNDHKPFYKLNLSQEIKILYAVRLGDVAWCVPMPIPTDDEITKKGLDELNQEMCDLVALELAYNASSSFADRIKNALENHGRHVRYFAPTRLAFQMFSNSDKRMIQ